MGRGWKSLGVHDKRILDCLKETFGRNMDIKGNSSEGSERSKESYRKSFCCLRKNIDYYRQTGARNRNVRGAFHEVQDGIEECIFGNWRKSDPCYKVAENLAELCSAIQWWKVELISEELDI